MACMKANKKYLEARNLTYEEFPQKFAWKTDFEEWCLRKWDFAIGRLYNIASSSDHYYLRLLLAIVKGCTYDEYIRTINGEKYEKLRDTCFTIRLLDDNNEYINGIIEQ